MGNGLSKIKVAGSILAGAIVGFGAGILLAPKSGKETRENVLDKAETVKDEIQLRYYEIKDKVVETAEKMQDEITDTKEEIKEKVIETAEKVHEDIVEKTDEIKEKVKGKVSSIKSHKEKDASLKAKDKTDDENDSEIEFYEVLNEGSDEEDINSEATIIKKDSGEFM